MSEKRFALLIDAENIAAKHLETILREVTNYGKVIYRRVYGDFSDTQMKTWKEKILKHALTSIQQFPYTTGKNAADIALVIDALDILYNKDVDGFCLVSSDSDFTGLAIYLREAGKEVIGIGKSDASKTFKKACCSGFVSLTESSKKKKINNDNTEMTEEEISKLIIKLIKKEGDSGIFLGKLGKEIRKHDPKFNLKLKEYIQKNISEVVIEIREKNQNYAVIKEGK